MTVLAACTFRRLGSDCERDSGGAGRRRRVNLGAGRARVILARVRSVPPGRVTTYADLDPAAPRHAGAVLSACADPSVPWHRVVRSDGSLAKGERQRRRLEREGVTFAGERVEMAAAWVPPEAPEPRMRGHRLHSEAARG